MGECEIKQNLEERWKKTVKKKDKECVLKGKRNKKRQGVNIEVARKGKIFV